MNLILDDVVQILATGLIPLLRISALLLAAPLGFFEGGISAYSCCDSVGVHGFYLPDA